MTTIAISQSERPRFLVDGDEFHVVSPTPILQVSYPFKAKSGKVMKSVDHYLVVKLIAKDGKVSDPAVMVLREYDWTSLKGELGRMKARAGLDPTALDTWYAVVLDRGVRVYEKR